jgi:hypothetical protein
MFALGYSFDAFLKELVEITDKDEDDFVQAKTSAKIIGMMNTLVTGEIEKGRTNGLGFLDECSVSITRNLLVHKLLTSHACHYILGKKCDPANKPNGIICRHTIGAYSTQASMTCTMLRVLGIAEMNKSGRGKYTIRLKDDSPLVSQLRAIFHKIHSDPLPAPAP